MFWLYMSDSSVGLSKGGGAPQRRSYALYTVRGFAWGSAPKRRDLVRREPNDAILFGESRTMRAERRSGASQLRSIDHRGFAP